MHLCDSSKATTQSRIMPSAQTLSTCLEFNGKSKLDNHKLPNLMKQSMSLDIRIFSQVKSKSTNIMLGIREHYTMELCHPK